MQASDNEWSETLNHTTRIGIEIETIQSLDPGVKTLGIDWLQDLVSSVTESVFAEIPSYR